MKFTMIVLTALLGLGLLIIASNTDQALQTEAGYGNGLINLIEDGLKAAQKATENEPSN